MEQKSNEFENNKRKEALIERLKETKKWLILKRQRKKAALIKGILLIVLKHDT